MSLADDIIASKGHPNGLDELGLPTRMQKDLDYTVARILIKHRNLGKNPNTGEIIDLDSADRAPIAETSKSVVKLSGFDSPYAKGNLVTLVFDRLRELLRDIDMYSFQICDGLVFDADTRGIKSVPTREEEDDFYRGVLAAKDFFDRKEKEENGN